LSTANRRCREKFHAALHRLAVAEGDVRSRLKGAYRHLRCLSEDQVPSDLRAEWIAILKALTRFGPECDPDGTLYQTAIDHTMSRIKNRTGRAMAERIYNLVQEVD